MKPSLTVVSDLSLGKSSQSIHIHGSTSHDQCVWSTSIEHECTKTQLNGSQFRQVYSITHITFNHSQTQHENNTRMHVEDTHRWDWACLNIIHSEWESLSRVMWRGYWNVWLVYPLLFLVLSIVSLGKSSKLKLIHAITSHYQCGWFIIAIEKECTITHLNGSQFRQV